MFQFQPQHPTHSKETERKTKEVEDGKREKENGHVSFFITKTDTITSSLTSLYFLLSLTLFLLASCKLVLISNQQNITMKKHVIYEPQFVLGEEGIRDPQVFMLSINAERLVNTQLLRTLLYIYHCWQPWNLFEIPNTIPSTI